ncbi:hypothetical protein HOT49_gp033 [Erwinia phage vB_EamM_Alexandra]|uniref:Uncharacterized protein n=1 Tax=Erwinia phage vB_EamM_Alexandra TaxID=2201424 RepID=A0A2Z4QE06_9CAUD|nr:hypothetical protein HOT49_gp033 [Erwinia phage vB_EamM_Alexandra]AWY08313.1 hypothetical protein Alexandra_33 [Erwinia phage vB_EamM_Alexandra]
MEPFLKDIKDRFAAALGIDPKILDAPVDEESVERFSAFMREDQRKIKVGIALCHLQIPDDVRYDLLHNHLDTTERLLRETFDGLAAQLVAVNGTGGGDEKQAASGAYRLAMLMNILGFDNETLKGVLTDPSLTRQAGLIAMTGLNDMGQKIQQLYDEKTK